MENFIVCEDCAGENIHASLMRFGAEYECQDCGAIFFDTDQEVEA